MQRAIVIFLSMIACGAFAFIAVVVLTWDAQAAPCGKPQLAVRELQMDAETYESRGDVTREHEARQEVMILTRENSGCFNDQDIEHARMLAETTRP